MPNTYYISPSGNDTTGNGTSGNPWQTLAKAYNSSASGDTIEMAAGSYAFASLNLNKILTFNAPSPVDGVPVVTWDGASASVVWNVGNTYNLTVNNVLIKDAKNSGASAIFNVSYSPGGSGSAILTFNNCIFRNLRVEGYGDSCGVWAAGYTGPFTLILNACVVEKIKRTNPASHAAAALVGSRNGTLIWTNCVIYLDGTGGDQLLYLFSGLGGTLTLTFKNCVFYNAGSAVGWNSHTGTVVNAVTYSDGYGVSLPAGTGNLAVAPLFVDAANDDFHLAQNSPCRGMGTYL